MKLNKRVFDYSEKLMKDAIKEFSFANEENKVLDQEVLTSFYVTEDAEQESVYLEVVKKIEDFAEIIINDGFDIQTQTQYNLRDLSLALDNFMAEDFELSNGNKRQIAKDLSLSTLGFVATQVITRLVSKIDRHDLEAWQLVSQDQVLEDGEVIYNVVQTELGEAATTRISEGGDYNTLHLESTEDYIKTSKGKVGVMVSYSEEAARRCGIQAIKMLTEAAIADMKRFKTIEAIRLLDANAKVKFDGLDPAKMPSGTSFQKPDTLNGTILYKDLETMFCDAQTDGKNIDVVFIHPLGQKTLYREPAVKEFLAKNANIIYFVPKKRQTIAYNMLTKLKKKTSGTQFAAEGEDFKLPQLLANQKINIVVTPFVKYHKIEEDIYTPETRYTLKPVVQHKYNSSKPRLYPCTDILFIDSTRALTHVHDGRGIISDKIEDRLKDITSIKFKTYYRFILDKDHGVYAFRNISVTDDVFNRYQNPTVTISHAELFK